jgi:hypothetical protein
MSMVTIINNGGRVQVVTTVGRVPAQPGGGGTVPAISADPDNRLKTGSDGGLHVQDSLTPDPLAYYILAKG